MNENYHFLIKDPLYSDRAVYSDLNPLDGGQSLYPMGTVFELLLDIIACSWRPKPAEPKRTGTLSDDNSSSIGLFILYHVN